jgi:hypothetical protein
MRSRADERARLSAAIGEATSRVAALEAERARELERIGALRAELAMIDAAAASIEVESSSAIFDAVTVRPAGEKLAIFGRLFRGRADVYPTRFVSRDGKQGYGPACGNKFVRGKCELPRVKCGECTNQAFLPADDTAYLAHLRGDHVMGIYPMPSRWDVLVPRRRLRQGNVDGGRRRVHRDLSAARLAVSSRAFAFR